MLSLASTLLYILFVLAAIVLVVVVLLQEGRGGGLTDALGTSGQQTFGVGASGINRFTGATAAVFLVSALLIEWRFITWIRRALPRKTAVAAPVNRLMPDAPTPKVC